MLTVLLTFAEQQQDQEKLGWVGDGVPNRKNGGMWMCFCLLLSVGSMWVNNQTGGWLGGPCQCVSVSVNPDQATDTMQTEKFPIT